MKHIRIAGGNSFKLGAAMGVPLILAMVGAASRLADTASAFPTAGVTPDKVKAALPEREKLVKDTLKKPGVSGIAVAAVYQDQVVYAKGFDVRERGKPDLVDADTVFQLASMSKPLGSTVIAGLVYDGVVKWDDRVIRHGIGRGRAWSSRDDVNDGGGEMTRRNIGR